MKTRGTVYLLHFEPPYKHAGHYRGYAEGGPKSVVERLKRHLAGNGARLVEVAAEAGSKVTLARIWRNKDRKFERRLKHRAVSALCPVCARRLASAERSEPCKESVPSEAPALFAGAERGGERSEQLRAAARPFI